MIRLSSAKTICWTIATTSLSDFIEYPVDGAIFFANLIMMLLAIAQYTGIVGAPWLPPSTRNALSRGLIPPAVITILRWYCLDLRAHLMNFWGKPAHAKAISVTLSSRESKASEQSRRAVHEWVFLNFESSRISLKSWIAIMVFPPLINPSWSFSMVPSSSIRSNNRFAILASTARYRTSKRVMGRKR